MNQKHNAVEHFTREFAAFEASLNGGKDTPVHAVRRGAIERFRTLGFPTLRNEEWRYTNLQPVTGTAFALARDVTASLHMPPLPFVSADDVLCVLVNGHFIEQLSSLGTVPPAVTVTTLGGALAQTPEPVLRHFDALQSDARDTFAELNTGFLRDGVFVHIPKNIVLPGLIHIHVRSVAGPDPLVTHPRILIVAEQGAQAGITLTFSGDGTYLTNAMTQTIVGENAVVDLYRMQDESPTAIHVSNLYARQERSAVFRDHAFLLGASLTRNSISVVLDGEGAETTLTGLSLAVGTQHIDTHTVIDHAKPHCGSREEYKGIIDGRGRGVFSGKIIVRKDAQKTDAKQSNNNLLLSDDASIDTKPQLEILADDVKCTHGATVGRLDENAIFYLRSRGIGAAEARDILTWAFAGDIVSQVTPTGLRGYLDEHIHAILHQS